MLALFQILIFNSHPEYIRYNFYASAELHHILVQYKMDMFKRLKRHKVSNDLQKKKLKEGEKLAYLRGNICIMKWKAKEMPPSSSSSQYQDDSA